MANRLFNGLEEEAPVRKYVSGRWKGIGQLLISMRSASQRCVWF